MKSSTSQLKPKWYQAGGALKHLDLFKEPLPGLNVRGLNSIASVTGGLVSLIIMTIMTLYATIKFFHLIDHHNPLVGSFE